MDYCKYHPLVSSTYHCEHCQISQCDSCVEHIEESNEHRCFVCGASLESLGAGSDVAPFWRRLDSAFQYPMNKQTLLLIIIASGLATVSAAIGGLLGFILSLTVTAVMTKYSFVCLQSTTNGEAQAPEPQEAFSGGFRMLLHIVIILIGISVMIAGVHQIFGPLISTLFSLFWMISLPAVFINYARFEEILPALNPIEIGRLVITLGRAYLMLLLFIMIMLASVGTLHQLLESQLSFFSAIPESIVSYYYLIVTFHLMGYLLFQKQRVLGFTSRLDSSLDEQEERSQKEHLLAKINVLVKEGEFDEVLRCFKEGMTGNPNDLELHNRFFDFLVGMKNIHEIDIFLPVYVELLKNNGHTKLSSTSYQRILVLDMNYIPSLAITRYQLAQSCFHSGKEKLTVKLLNGLHRDEPEFADLIPAYELMAKALDNLPNREKHAEKCRQLITSLKSKTADNDQN